MMDFHPLAEVLPLMEGEPFAELIADIKANGLREPIMVCDGKILDGRNRFRACAEAGVEPNLEYFNGGDPIAYVLSMNVHRRHLTTSQRAMIAAELANMRQGERTDRRPSANLQKVSIEEAAKLLNVSPRSVASAAIVRDHGTPEEKAAVRSGAQAASDIANNIRKRTQRQEKGGSKKGGERLRTPNGLTVEDWCRQGLAIEAQGKTPEVASTEIGFFLQSYRKARDIVQLADRSDLPVREAELARTTLADLNETGRLQANHAAIKHIVQRLVGTRRGPKSEGKRTERFENAIAVVVQACATGSQMEVPHLNRELAREIIDQLEQSRKQLGSIVAALKGIYQ
jgi:hypothetical protein